MNFLYPQFLWALFAISIPILIHLFNFRKFKKVFFSDLQLLKEVELETSKKSNLKHLLILLTRILAINALVFAFAQPYFPSKTNKTTQGEKSITVYVDNSFSMSNIAQEFTLLDKAKEQAEKIAKLHKQSDKFLLTTNDFNPKHQRYVTQQEFIELVKEIEESSSTRLLSEIEQKQIDFLNKEFGQNKIAYFVSDFQKSTSNLESLVKDSTIVSNYVQLNPEFFDNVYIDSIWFDSPIRVVGRNEKLFARIVNKSPDDIQVRAELFLNDNSETFVNQSVVSGGDKVVELTFKTDKSGVVHANLRISEYPNPIATFDDDYYFSFLLENSSQILVVNNNSEYLNGEKGSLNQLFINDSYFKVKNASVNSIDYSDFSTSNLIVLNELNSISSGLLSELLKYISSGGNVVYFPGEKMDIASVNEFMIAIEAARYTRKDKVSTKVDYLNFEHPIFKDVFEKIPKNIDLPKVYSSYQLSILPRARVERLMKLQSGNEFLSKFSYKKGNVFVFTIPLDEKFSNFTSHSLFVTSLLRIAENSGNKQMVSQFISSENLSIKDENYLLESIQVQSEKLGIDCIPETQRARGEIKLFLPEEVKQAGNYEVKINTDVIGGFGLNYNRMESNFSAFSSEELKEKLESTYANVIELSSVDYNSKESNTALKKEFKWWKVFILLSLLFIALEIIFIKIMK